MLQKLQEARQTAQTISARSGKKPIFSRVENISGMAEHTVKA